MSKKYKYMKDYTMDQVRMYWTGNITAFIAGGDPGINIIECKIFFIRGFISAIYSSGGKVTGASQKEIELYFPPHL